MATERPTPLKQLETMLKDRRLVRTISRGLTEKIDNEDMAAKRNDFARQMRKSGAILPQTAAKVAHWYGEYVALSLTSDAMESEPETQVYLDRLVGYAKKSLTDGDRFSQGGIKLEKVAELGLAFLKMEDEQRPFITPDFIEMAKKAVAGAQNLSREEIADFVSASDAFEAKYTETFNRYSGSRGKGKANKIAG
ncbi:hypothetical protein J4227_04700 [Candidatus Woesearchaeota archaeon]|nr:hypothetical protein [Candidatus Woesearchaeota archaeon]